MKGIRAACVLVATLIAAAATGVATNAAAQAGAAQWPALAWGSPSLLEPFEEGNASPPRLGMAADGGYVALWCQETPLTTTLMAVRGRLGASASAPEAVSTGCSMLAFEYDVAAYAAGGAIAVWRGAQGSGSAIFATRLTDGAWAAPTRISSAGLGVADFPRVAAGATGNAVAVWKQDPSDGAPRYVVFAAVFQPEGGWSRALVIANDSGQPSFNPAVVVGQNGSATALWFESSGPAQQPTDSIWSRDFTFGGRWGPAMQAVSQGTDYRLGLSLAQVRGGGFLLSLLTLDGESGAGVAARTPGGGWSPVEVLASHSGGAVIGSHAVGADPEGWRFLLWTQGDSPSSQQAWARVAAPGALWGAAEPLDVGAGASKVAAVAALGGGQALALWLQQEGDAWHLRGALHVSGDGWTAARWVDSAVSDVEARYGSLSLVGRPGGGAVAAWAQGFAGNVSAWIARFPEAPDPEDPLFLAVADPAVAVAGETVVFRAQPLNGAASTVDLHKYRWTVMENGSTVVGYGRSMNHTFMQAGRHAATLHVEYLPGLEARVTAVVNVVEPSAGPPQPAGVDIGPPSLALGGAVVVSAVLVFITLRRTGEAGPPGRAAAGRRLAGKAGRARRRRRGTSPRRGGGARRRGGFRR